jgi:hypothetical protein
MTLLRMSLLLIQGHFYVALSLATIASLSQSAHFLKGNGGFDQVWHHTNWFLYIANCFTLAFCKCQNHKTLTLHPSPLPLLLHSSIRLDVPLQRREIKRFAPASLSRCSWYRPRTIAPQERTDPGLHIPPHDERHILAFGDLAGDIGDLVLRFLIAQTQDTWCCLGGLCLGRLRL